jgi:hypothetical protein
MMPSFATVTLQNAEGTASNVRPKKVEASPKEGSMETGVRDHVCLAGGSGSRHVVSAMGGVHHGQAGGCTGGGVNVERLRINVDQQEEAEAAVLGS